jgi:hypothetical protein
VAAKPEGDKRRGKGQGGEQQGDEGALLNALKRLVERASSKPTAGLLDRLQTLVAQAASGKSISSSRAARKRKAREKKKGAGKAGTPGGQGESGKGRGDRQVVVNRSPGPRARVRAMAKPRAKFGHTPRLGSSRRRWRKHG